MRFKYRGFEVSFSEDEDNFWWINYEPNLPSEFDKNKVSHWQDGEEKAKKAIDAFLDSGGDISKLKKTKVVKLGEGEDKSRHELELTAEEVKRTVQGVAKLTINACREAVVNDYEDGDEYFETVPSIKLSYDFHYKKGGKEYHEGEMTVHVFRHPTTGWYIIRDVYSGTRDIEVETKAEALRELKKYVSSSKPRDL